MANTMTLISSITVGSGGATTMDFTSIPSTYTDLLLDISARSTVSSVYTQIFTTFNNTSTGYYRMVLQGFAGSASSSSQSNTTQFNTSYIPGGTATANTFGNFQLYIPNYAGSNKKTASLDAAMENNDASNNVLQLDAFLWDNTAAINRITLTSQDPNFAQYSTAYLYGIKNS